MARKGNSALRAYARQQAEAFCDTAGIALECRLANLRMIQDVPSYRAWRLWERHTRMRVVACSVAKRLASDLL